MPNIQNEILNWIGNKTVSIDELHDFIKLKLDDSYEIGDAGVIINDMIAGELLIANDFPTSSIKHQTSSDCTGGRKGDAVRYCQSYQRCINLMEKDEIK